MLQRSQLTNRLYEEEEMVFFRNPVQSAFYYLNGAELIDLFPTKELKFVFVFRKSDHDKLKLLWEERKISKTKDDRNG